MDFCCPQSHDVDGNVEMPQVAIAPLELGGIVHHIATICCLDLPQLCCGSLILSHVEGMSTFHLKLGVDLIASVEESDAGGPQAQAMFHLDVVGLKGQHVDC